MKLFRLITPWLILVCSIAIAVEPATQNEGVSPQAFLAKYCVECHASDDAEANVQLDKLPVDWKSDDSLRLWTQIYTELHTQRMPPADAANQPNSMERERVTDWLEKKLIQHSKVGGTVPRRLNRVEYQNTVRDLFDWQEFTIPDAFPSDDLAHGFDNIGEALVISPPLMAQYLKLATQVADEIFPPASAPEVPVTKEYKIGVQGLATSAGGERIAGGTERFRLVGSQNMASMAAWPKRFEATQSGVYRITVRATTYQTDKQFYKRRTEPFRLTVYSRPKTTQVYDKFEDIKNRGQFDVRPTQGELQSFTGEIELYAGEMFGLRWEDGPVYSAKGTREVAHEFFDDRLRRSRPHYAAMLEYKGGPRGATRSELYEATSALMKSNDLDLRNPQLDQLPENYGGGLSDLPHAWLKKYVLEEMHRHGPALDLLDVEIVGPLRLVEDDVQRTKKARTDRFVAANSDGSTKEDEAFVPVFVERFLSNAFRREATPAQIAKYVGIVRTEMEQGDVRVEDGLHLAVRSALVSPHFLFRSSRKPRLDEFDLANRLSYFLTSSPPDARLTELAASGKLSQKDVLEAETERLLRSPRSERFVHHFTAHWLSTRMLQDIMPDPRLLKFFDPDRRAMIDEVEMFFAEMLRENHSIDNFIDPGFSYRNRNSNKIYGGELVGPKMQRVTFERGGREGGLLSMAAVMMATANGVDTHPVHRGVWLLDNIFGSPTPPPPENVPAISPDTNGTKTIRSQLAAHRADKSCASCHDKIDPLGMIMENFDPVGRWRTHYPIYEASKGPLKEEFYKSIGNGTRNGPPIDAATTMPDGTRLQNVTELKLYVLQRLDQFSTCLAEKLLIYGTGRTSSFGDRRVVQEVVADVKQRGNGFRDLVIAVVLSDAFATK